MKKKKKRKPRWFGMFEFPSQVVSQGVSVSIFDEYGCTVRNYTEIISYSPTLIILLTPIGRLMLCGSGMTLMDSDSRELKLTGRVRSAEFSGD